MIASLALLAALRADPDTSGCRPDELRAAASGAEISTLGRSGGADVVLAGPHASCFCGNVNCPWYVLRLAGSRPDVLLETYGYAATHAAGGAALPDVTVTAHDSALISYRTIYVLRGDRYAANETWMERGDTGASKRAGIPIRFAPGTSSAALHGSAGRDWGDTYAFAAARGQRLTIDGVRAASAVRFSLLPDGPEGAATSVPLVAGVPAVLPRTGPYTLAVDGDADDPVPYAFTLTIR